MVRRMEAAELGAVAEIWLEANLDAHDFVPEIYWRSQLEPVRESIWKAEVYVYEEDGAILGFIGLDGETVEGLFVKKEARSRGIGKALLDRAREGRDLLELRVYSENWPAVKFYYREGFTLFGQDVDRATGQDESLMAWWA